MGPYFDLKKHYFCGSCESLQNDKGNGYECLTWPLKLKDLTEEDMWYFKTGFLQLLPIRDAAGRTVNIVFDIINQHKIPIASLIRIYMYAGSFLARSEETQQSGTVLLALGLQQQQPGWVGEETLATKVVDVCANLPVRRMATHYLHDLRQPLLGANLMATYTPHMRPFEKARLRSHCVDHTNCTSVLGSLGIPIEGLPIHKDQQGEIQVEMKSHLAFLEEQKSIEEAEEKAINIVSQQQQQWQQQQVNPLVNVNSITNKCVALSDQDVVMERDFLNRNHPGNIHYRAMMKARFSEYEYSNRVGKKAIVNDIIKRMQDSGARFVYRLKSSSAGEIDHDQWVEAEVGENTRKNCSSYAQSSSEGKILTTTREIWMRPAIHIKLER